MLALTQLGTRVAVPTLALSFALVALGCDDDPDPSPLDGATPDAALGDAATDGGDFALSLFMRGDAIYLRATGGDVQYRSCSDAIRLEKRAGDTWVAPQDDRHPDSNNPGYYLDGVFIGPSSNLGCDAVTCSVGHDEVFVAQALEYVKTGEQPAPADAPTAKSPAPVIERRPLRGKLRVTLEYSRMQGCGDSHTETFFVDIPSEGVCCPIGDEGCSSEGPGGGWAPTFDACEPYSIEYDGYSVVQQDPWGCPTLQIDESVCCGCVPDADAGL